MGRLGPNSVYIIPSTLLTSGCSSTYLFLLMTGPTVVVIVFFVVTSLFDVVAICVGEAIGAAFTDDVLFPLNADNQCAIHTLLHRLPLKSKGKNFVIFVCGICLLHLEKNASRGTIYLSILN